jgi:hypothetical protein
VPKDFHPDDSLSFSLAWTFRAYTVLRIGCHKQSSYDTDELAVRLPNFDHRRRAAVDVADSVPKTHRAGLGSRGMRGGDCERRQHDRSLLH